MEIWKVIDGYPGYSVSNLGNVKKLATTMYDEQIGEYPCLDSYLCPKVYNGFLCVNFSNRSFAVHKLVALAFIPNPDNKLLVCHIDGDVRNNTVDNLVWCTRSEYNKLRQKFVTTSLIPPKFSGKKVFCVETREIFQSIKEAADRLNISSDRLSKYIYSNRTIDNLHYIFYLQEGIDRDQRRN